jgi:hypothetical protein
MHVSVYGGGETINMKNNEKRKNPRIPVSVPVSCITIDLDDTPTNFFMAVVKDISQRGVLVDLFGELETDTVLLSFITVKNETIEIKAKIVHVQAVRQGVAKAGLLLLGEAQSRLEFIRQLVYAHHYTQRLPHAGCE